LRALTPRDAYRRLLARFGAQGWWPVTPPGGSVPRYRPGCFRPPDSAQAAEVCIGAILTQNTAWSNVEKALAALHAARAADLRRILRVPRARLERWIRPSGYYSQKAFKLRCFAAHVLGRARPLRSWLRDTPLPALREELLSIHGIGPETADSILLYAGGRPVFVVDAYTRRIGSRVGWFPEASSYDRIQRFFVARLPRSVRLYNECHALLVALAKARCRKKPSCPGCPLAAGCRTGRRGVSHETAA